MQRLSSDLKEFVEKSADDSRKMLESFEAMLKSQAHPAAEAPSAASVPAVAGAPAGVPLAEADRELGDGWLEYRSEDGRPYFYNSRTGEITWQQPV